MNDIDLLRNAGPDTPPLRPAVLDSARSLLAAEINRSTDRSAGLVPLRRGNTGRAHRTRAKVIGGAAVAAAACLAAVAVLAPGSPAGPTGEPATSVTLVGIEMPTFPLSLAQVPSGLSPKPGLEGSDGSLMLYYDSSRPDGVDILRIRVDDEQNSDHGGGDSTDVTVDGRPGEFVVTPLEGVDYEMASLEWERRPGQWVTVSGDGRLADEDRLVAAAESLVDQPQALPLRLTLAPAGWSLQFFKESGRIVTLVNDAYPDQTMTLDLPEEAIPPADLPRMLESVAGPMQETSVNGLPAQLVPTNYGWYLQGQFPDGTTFAVQAPAAFTAEQVLAVAGQVVYTP